jgi:hypothetical protein
MEKLLRESKGQSFTHDFYQKLAKSFKSVLFLNHFLFFFLSFSNYYLRRLSYVSIVAVHLVVLGNLSSNGLRLLLFLYSCFSISLDMSTLIIIICEIWIVVCNYVFVSDTNTCLTPDTSCYFVFLIWESLLLCVRH